MCIRDSCETKLPYIAADRDKVGTQRALAAGQDHPVQKSHPIAEKIKIVRPVSSGRIRAPDQGDVVTVLTKDVYKRQPPYSV